MCLKVKAIRLREHTDFENDDAMEDISKTEMEIMLVLWHRGPVAVRDIVEAVYQSHTQTLHTTVKSLLERLMRKSYVLCDRTAHVHLFSAKFPKEKFVQTQIDKLAESIFEGDVGPVLLSMVDKMHLNKKDKAVIEGILEKLK